MPPKAKAKAAGKQNALQAEGWCCSGGSGANVGGPVFGTVCCSLDWLRSFGPPLWRLLTFGRLFAISFRILLEVQAACKFLTGVRP